MTGAVEEDYRVKNAREGKAVYLPGKTTEQMRAILAAEAAEANAKVRPLTFTAEEVERFVQALSEVCIRINQAETVFALLSEVQAGGDHRGHHGLADMAGLAAKALGSLGEKEVEDLATLRNRLRACA